MVAALVLQVFAGKVHFVPPGPDRTQVRSAFSNMIGSFFPVDSYIAFAAFTSQAMLQLKALVLQMSLWNAMF